MGAQILVYSELGSEGRNFQFAHHLVLFDLPLNPDLLEQRIERLRTLAEVNPNTRQSEIQQIEDNAIALGDYLDHAV